MVIIVSFLSKKADVAPMVLSEKSLYRMSGLLIPAVIIIVYRH